MADKTPEAVFIVAGHASSLVNFRLPLLRKFQSLGYEVHACAPGLTSDRQTAETLKGHGIQLHDVAFERTGLNPLSDLHALWQLRRTMRAQNAQIFLGYTAKPVIWGTLAAAAARVPKRVALITGLGYAFTGQATGKRRVLQGILRRLYKLALGRASHVFFQNPDDAAEFRTLGLIAPEASTSVVNGSGVDLAHFTPAPLPTTPGITKFLLIARMLGDKGIREFAEAAGRIRQDHPNAEFHLVGGTDSNPNAIPRPALKAWEQEFGIVWHGAQGDVRSFLADCHVYVLPSYREGTPRSVLEAMATGRAIVTTDAPGCRETVTQGANGFLVPPQDADALEAALRRFLKTPDLIASMGQKSLEMAREKYDVQRVNEQMFKDIGLPA
ncbi:Glycosyltransferase involved in cell wall bisynthesis [Roseovarius nanhaiticus]|uniref:Glycosyltransferase involved in cell wall bisynthesis n=1 Tax=Roseovarius nanhaiticus TaxID=573024 RepID=A0A1N7EPC2_9RHOB|nr:glycosyltransferase family 4 protein [Roseovarius nanhaiticus]SEK70169.1 Glycosyltransferase involved in cell wall bisynthesis [Roseovarius nanhaiticus]SIR89879.1 Glycosyltransferase involved in cell wall bisynthesis [Roseovarius nanhaiticus]